MDEYTFEELSAKTAVAANNLDLKPGQEEFVVPPSFEAASLTGDQGLTWAGVVLCNTEVVGLVRAIFDENASSELFESCLLRIAVDADWQGKGVGKFAISNLVSEAKRRGFSFIRTVWEAGDMGPGDFFTRIGFTPVGETEYGETIGEIQV